MKNSTLLIKVKERLNKLASNDYDNIEDWQVLEAFNKAQLQYVRQQLKGLNAKGEVDEGSKQLIDDLQVLLDSKPLATTLLENAYEQAALPENYLAFKRVSARAKSPCCEVAHALKFYPCIEADVDTWLRDENHRPDFEWAESFYTLAGGNVHLYTAGLFTLLTPKLTFYRKPRRVQIAGVFDLQLEADATVDQECELPEAICELLVDATCGVLAGDTENGMQYQRAKQEVTSNT